MALLVDLIALEITVSTLLDVETVQAKAIVAVNFYAGYSRLMAFEQLAEPYPAVSIATEITESEWAVIRSLFLLYVEKENAIVLEASRGMGVDVFGRSVSEVSSDITQYEMELPHKAFYQPIRTV